MKPAIKVSFLLLLLVATSWAARRRDPLTDAESDQLREVATQPFKRLKLLIKFTEARLDAIDQLRADPKDDAGRGKQIHDRLEDFTALLDETNDNLDQYQARPLNKDDRKDFRKGLREVMLACDRFRGRLGALQAAIRNDPRVRKESEDYMFVLQDAQDALKSTSDMAREYYETGDADKPGEKKKD